MKVAIVGAGWAGLAAAVQATLRGHEVTVFEAAPQVGGRARGVPLTLPDGRQITVDNGQHILIGAYRECLRLMRIVGVDPGQALLRLPLTLGFADGAGLRFPDMPPPIDALWAILTARGWRWRERLALLRAANGWRRDGFVCAAGTTVAGLCAHLPSRLVADFIEPLCVAALNTPVRQASGQVFLRVLHDALLGGRGASQLLLPRTDLGSLFPQAAARWLAAQGGAVSTGTRIDTIHPCANGWQVGETVFDQVIWATSAPHAALAIRQSAAAAEAAVAGQMLHWSGQAARLEHRAITTVYAQAQEASPQGGLLASPMLALRSAPDAPAQFVFERDAITGTGDATGILAFVVSDSPGNKTELEAAVIDQARRELKLHVQPLLTITEKRATFACTAGLERPPALIAPGLLACGDYIAGPYPATLEGAVRSGLATASALATGG